MNNITLTKEQAKELLNAVEFLSSSLESVSGLFLAIEKLASDIPEIKATSEIGKYILFDWGMSFGSAADEIKAALHIRSTGES